MGSGLNYINGKKLTDKREIILCLQVFSGILRLRWLKENIGICEGVFVVSIMTATNLLYSCQIKVTFFYIYINLN